MLQVSNIRTFKQIKGLDPYMINRRGDILNSETDYKLTPHCNARGYLKIKLKGKCRYIHLLVLATFKGKRPPGAHGCHKDDNPKNNRIGNLKWDTPENNYAQKRKPVAKGEEVYTAKLTKRKVKEIKRLGKLEISNRQIAKIFDVAHTTIGKILNGERWGHVI